MDGPLEIEREKTETPLGRLDLPKDAGSWPSPEWRLTPEAYTVGRARSDGFADPYREQSDDVRPAVYTLGDDAPD